MKRFFNTNPFRVALTKASIICSGPDAKALVNLVYPLLLKRSADPQGLVDYSHRLQRGELTPLSFMQELMNSKEYQQAQGEYDHLADASVHTYFSDEVLTLSAQLEACQQVSRKD